ncbi:MAG: hypothetical protein AMXMBFR64_46340 [Myxococcales bacterium]
MRPVLREEILDWQTYGEQRAAMQERIFPAKAARRIHVGPHLTFLFENRDTVRYQIQEMMRAERIVREADIRHEIDTYNELLGGPGELGFTLLIEIEDATERPAKLAAWLTLPEHIYALTGDGERVRATFDPRQVGDTQVSSVQYMKIDTGGRVPVAIGVDHPAYTAEARLSDEQRTALAADLADD